MQIIVNEEPTEVATRTTIADLLTQLKLDPRFLAVERNLVLVPRSEHADCTLEAGDHVEIVTLVGGG